MDVEETYVLLLLSDGNLPTGSFVASSGLESYITHGFLSHLEGGQSRDKLSPVTDFIRDSLSTYAHSALPFVSDAHRVVQEHVQTVSDPKAHKEDLQVIESGLRDLLALDELYDSMTLNHVAKRASKSQGVALLTLYTKGFSKPPTFHRPPPEQPEGADEPNNNVDAILTKLVDKLKFLIRREDTHGHLPVCWGVLTAALGLSLERCQFLHLFLHARSLLSAAVRMNTLGPYAAQQLLLHSIRPLVTTESSKCANLRTGIRFSSPDQIEGETQFDGDILTAEGPATTWPLGEILAARHDLQHSRVFNS